MKVGVIAGYWSAGPPAGVEQQLAEAEAAGVDSFWTSEAYGSDALSPLAWWGARTSSIKLGTAVCQMSARTPTALAMAAMTLDHLSGGRVILGIGASGPQVVEGWYGQPYDRPLERTREYIEIMRAVWARKEPVTYDGRHYQLPLAGGTGLGKALRATVHPLRESIPVYLGAQGPKNVALAAEVADGWIPQWFSPKTDAFYREALAEGFGRPAARHDATTFEVANLVPLIEGDDLDKAASVVKAIIALYAGGMGAREANFHNNILARAGWEDVCDEIQRLYLAGKRELAMQAVPMEMVEDFALVGPADKIVEEISTKWSATCTTTLLLGGWPRPDTRERILDAARA